MLNVFAQRSDPYPDSRHTRAGAGCWGRALTFTWGHDPAAAGRRRLRRFPSRRGPRWTESRAYFVSSDGCPDDGHHRLPLVIGLPGYGRTSEELAAQSRIPARAMAAGVLAVLPQAAGSAKSWNLSGTTDNGDVSFLSALVTRLAATECADPARVVITGISDGGDMAVFAACAMSLIHISEPTRLGMNSYAVFCLKKK